MTAQQKLLAAYPQLAAIDKYSLRVALLISKTFPQWMGYARAETYKDGTYLAVYVPSPVNPQVRDMIITSYLSEITIHFDYFHCYFGRSSNTNTAKTAFESAKAFIYAILDEEIVVGIKRVTGSVVMAKMYFPDEIQRIPPGEITYLRSWLGTYNRRLE